MATAVAISAAEMHAHLTGLGFVRLDLPGAGEAVYAKLVASGLSLRVYTSIAGDLSRDVGEDAIRVCVVAWVRQGGRIVPVGRSKRVHRVAGWKRNLQSRLDNWQAMMGPPCPKCGGPTVLRTMAKGGDFWGCAAYPACRSRTAKRPRACDVAARSA